MDAEVVSSDLKEYTGFYFSYFFFIHVFISITQGIKMCLEL